MILYSPLQTRFRELQIKMRHASLLQYFAIQEGLFWLHDLCPQNRFLTSCVLVMAQSPWIRVLFCLTVLSAEALQTRCNSNADRTPKASGTTTERRLFVHHRSAMSYFPLSRQLSIYKLNSLQLSRAHQNLNSTVLSNHHWPQDNL